MLIVSIASAVRGLVVLQSLADAKCGHNAMMQRMGGVR